MAIQIYSDRVGELYYRIGPLGPCIETSRIGKKTKIMSAPPILAATREWVEQFKKDHGDRIEISDSFGTSLNYLIVDANLSDTPVYLLISLDNE